MRQSLIERVREATADRKPLCIRGGGTKDWYGGERVGDVLDVSAYQGIVDYDPAELVITARCGTPLVELEAALASKNQMLACEPPHFAQLGTSSRVVSGQDTSVRTTVGGCVAAGLSGPRRAYAGSVRDFLLGATLLDGRGDALHFGGRVMKNVAGYDVARALAGSLGILGVILEVSLKVLPQPQAFATLRFECDEAEALKRLNEWAGLPLPISASAWQMQSGVGVLVVRLSGFGSAVESACAKLGGERTGETQSNRYWKDIRDHRLAFFSARSAEQRLWRLGVPSNTPALPLATAPLIEWGGAQRWYVTSEDAEEMRLLASARGGHAVVFRQCTDRVDAFSPLSSALHGIHERLKLAFDPAGVFNRRRMFASL